MQNAQGEEYVFYRFASGDFLMAVESLKKISRYKEISARRALLLKVILAYCRPFKISRGKYSNYKLSQSFVPVEHKNLHDELIKYRDNVLAHTDLTVRRPKLHEWKTSSGQLFPIEFKSLDLKNLENSIPELKELIGKILNRIQKQLKTLEAWLP
jgi:hypothetical protein